MGSRRPRCIQGDGRAGVGASVPPPPQRGDDVFEACAYWAPLLHLLLYRVGWSRPDLGVRQWFDDGKPTDDETLALLSALWDADGQLDWFAQWLWVNWTSFPVPLRNVPGAEACPRLQIHYTVLERLRGRRTPRVRARYRVRRRAARRPRGSCFDQRRVGGAREPLSLDGVDVVAVIAEDFDSRGRDVLVELDLHAPAGRL